MVFGLVCVLVVALVSVSFGEEEEELKAVYHEYIILGAGPSGLQMGYLLQHFDEDSNYDYLIIERNGRAGNFFSKYPRNRRLLSINKVYTGSEHHEFSLRHDWNSLLTPKRDKTGKRFTNNLNTEHYKMRFANYTEQYYPDRQFLANYLGDFPEYYKLNVLYNTRIVKVEQDELNDNMFMIEVETLSKPQNIYEAKSGDEKDDPGCTITRKLFSCKKLFVATGLSKENVPPIPGIEHATSYSQMSMNLDDYKNKKMAVLGGKNSAFEVASFVSQVSAYTHILPILMPRFSYETHYVGDVRAVNMEFIDHYLLKSLDAMTERTILDIEIVYNETTKTIELQPKEEANLADMHRPWPLRGEYDEVIYATGWLFDCKIFSEELCAKLLPNPRKVRYPAITNQYAARRVPNMYMLGGLMHSVDWKKSAGGFIHGYRYMVKTVFHQFVEKSLKNTKIDINTEELTKYLMFRVNTASSYYQMFAVMGDLAVVRKKPNGGETYTEYFFDMLMAQLNTLGAENDDECVAIVTLSYDYSEEFIGHDVVLYDRERVIQDYRKADESKFLHPVLRHYSCKVLDNKNDNSYQDYAASKYKLSERHIIEDFLTLWDDDKFHFQWLKTWIEQISGVKQIDWSYSEQDMLDAYF